MNTPKTGRIDRTGVQVGLSELVDKKLIKKISAFCSNDIIMNYVCD
jgi:hypothetical protein